MVPDKRNKLCGKIMKKLKCTLSLNLVKLQRGVDMKEIGIKDIEVGT